MIGESVVYIKLEPFMSFSKLVFEHSGDHHCLTVCSTVSSIGENSKPGYYE